MDIHNEISSGTVHRIPDDLKKVLTTEFETLKIWESLTPIARNEWICWIQNAKKDETRIRRIQGLCSELKEGKKRPCCWPGCSHRK